MFNSKHKEEKPYFQQEHNLGNKEVEKYISMSFDKKWNAAWTLRQKLDHITWMSSSGGM
jgi:hypothetical protein